MRKPVKKITQGATAAKRGGGSTFVGILIGLVLGLTIALGVAWYINKLPNPFREKSQAPAVPAAPKAETPAVVAKAEPSKEPADAAKAKETKDAKEIKDTVAEKDKADKSKATPDTSAKGDATAEKTAEKSTPAARETFFLQTGSFQNAPDADSLKARLALLGIEASIQARTLPEKGVWHRVRVGPYSDVEELNRVRGILTQNGIETALVKVRETDK